MPRSFFEANLGTVAPANTTLTVLLPQNNTGGGTLKLTAGLKYRPYFFPAFAELIGKPTGLGRHGLRGDVGDQAEEHAGGGARPRQFGFDERDRDWLRQEAHRPPQGGCQAARRHDRGASVR